MTYFESFTLPVWSAHRELFCPVDVSGPDRCPHSPSQQQTVYSNLKILAT